MGMTPAEFVRARLDEDESTALAATPGPWTWDVRMPSRGDAFIARHDPARVLREVAALREFVTHYEARERQGEPESIPDYSRGLLHAMRATCALLAGIWSDHPDYDSAWGA